MFSTKLITKSVGKRQTFRRIQTDVNNFLKSCKPIGKVNFRSDYYCDIISNCKFHNKADSNISESNIHKVADEARI